MPNKPVTFTAWDLAGLRDISEMGIALAGDEQRLRRKLCSIHHAKAIAPLVHIKRIYWKSVLFRRATDRQGR